jgi:hypothetical protein
LVTLLLGQASDVSGWIKSGDARWCGCFPDETQLTTWHWATFGDMLMAREVEHRVVSSAQCTQVVHGEPPIFRIHDVVRRQLLRKTPAFREQRAETFNKVSSMFVIVPILTVGDDLQVSSLFNPLLLVCAESNALCFPPVALQQLFGLLERRSAVAGTVAILLLELL